MLDFIRKLQWFYSLHLNASHSRCRFGPAPSTAWPPRGAVPEHILRLSRRIRAAAVDLLFSSHECYGTSNLSSAERELLASLTSDPDITIRPADKGGRWVIMDRASYIDECRRLLDDDSFYRPLANPLPAPPTPVTSHLCRMLSSRLITKKEFAFLSPSDSPRERTFSILPKVHKPLWSCHNTPPGRPIVADVRTNTSNLARFVEFFLFPLASRLPSFLLDSGHLIAVLRRLSLPSDATLCSLDVRSLYTNIPIEEGIRRVSRAFSSHPDPSRPDNEVIAILRHCLRQNDFLFADDRFLQTSGVSMGKAFGGSFANLYMGQWEAEALAASPHQPLLWKRFQDDIFFVWRHGEAALHDFVSSLNNLDANIQVDLHSSPDRLRFLDLEIYRGPHNNFGYRVGFKETDCHRLLRADSHHPPHVHKGVIFSQVLRWASRSSSEEDFRSTCHAVFPALRAQGVTRTVLRASLRRVMLLTNLLPSWSPGFRACGGTRCRACRFAHPCSVFSAASSGLSFPILHNLDCSSTHCVYVITCKRCFKQYVGQTSNPLGVRISQHLRDIRVSSSASPVAAHFSNGDCSSVDFSFFALERALSTSIRLCKEARWIRRLRSRFPNGMNNSDGSEVKKVNFVTRHGDCAERLNSVMRRFCRDAAVPLRCAYRADPNLGSILR